MRKRWKPSSRKSVLRSARRSLVVFAGPDYDLKAEDRQQQAKKLVADLPKETGVVVRGLPVGELRGLRWKALKGAAAEAADVTLALQKTAYGPVQTYAGVEALEE